MSVSVPDAEARGTQPAGAQRLRDRPDRLEPVFARLRDRVSTGVIPAAALAVGDLDGEIRSATFSGRRPLSRDSFFFLASVTKPIFATAFMQLVDDGAVDLHEPISRFVPEFSRDPDKARVTPWHLLTHTSGVADVPVDEIRRTRPSADQMTRSTIEAPLRFKPGTRWEYCSSSFYLLGLIMTSVTGLPYREFLRERVLAPLGMESTFDPRRSGRPIATVHGIGVENPVVRFFLLRYIARTAVPGGGLFGTLDDLLRFGAATLRPTRTGDRFQPLSPRSIELMMRDHTQGISGIDEGEERRVHHGLGWGKPTLMSELPGSERVVSHGGATGTKLWIDPDAGLVFVFFTNQWSPNRQPEYEALFGTYEAMR